MLDTPLAKTQGDTTRRAGLSGAAWGVLLLVAIVYGAWLARMPFTVEGHRYFVLADDAMISMRYAYFLAHGQGLVWNPGQRVEGITNLGWTAVMAAAHLLPFPLRLMSLLMQIVNLALHLALTAYVYLFVRPRAGGRAALAAALLVGLDAPLLAYGLTGFETSLQTLLVTLALLRFVPAPIIGTQSLATVPTAGLRWVPLLCALAFVVRPDAITLFVVGSGGALFLSGSDGRERRAVALSAAVGLCLLAGVLLFQHAYYGCWLPNTYYLKASADTRQWGRGIKYVAKFALQDGHLALLLAPLAFLLEGLRQRATRRAFAPVSALLGLWVCYIVWVGGDVFPLSRFWAPVIPLLVVCTIFFLRAHWGDLVQKTTETAAGGFGHKAGVGLVIALLALQVLASPLRVRSAVDTSKGGGRESVLYAAALGRQSLPPNTIIGVFLAGTTPYFMPRTQFHDFLGKCDTHIAHSPAHWGPPGHNKWDFAYSLGQVRPRYIITDAEYPVGSPEQTDAAMRQWVADRKDFGFHPSLWLDPLFRRDYVQTTVAADGGVVRGQSLYVRKAP